MLARLLSNKYNEEKDGDIMFENFPYTNFHDLNLDWIIEKVKEAYGPDNPPPNVVISVNGETGEVILYKDAIVKLPDVEENTWNIWRNADEENTGIQFRAGQPMQRIQQQYRYDVYDAGNPPPYPVRSVNGQTGAVTITIPVTSVNGMTGAITLYPNAVIAFPDVEASAWNMGRGSDGKLTGIQFIKDAPAQRMNGTNRYDIYDTGNPPPYPVTSVNTLTGNIAILDTSIVTESGTQKIKIAFPVTSVDGMTGVVKTWANTSNDTLKPPVDVTEANVWQLVRGIPSGDAGIRFEYDSTDDEISGYLVFDDGENTPLKLKILTPADIPSSSGVVSINSMTGVVTLTGSDINRSSTDTTKIDSALDDIEYDIQDLENDVDDTRAAVAYNEDGNTASQNITSGSFVIWKGHAYTANGNITSGDTLQSGTNLTPVTGGISNALNSKITNGIGGVSSTTNNITSYTSINNAYTCSEGYVRVSGNGETVYAVNKNGTDSVTLLIGDGTHNISIFVKKGTKVFCSSGASTARFIPIQE